jgi:predicted transport protein
MQPSLYKISAKIEALKETPFKKERELQNIFEANLPQIIGLILVKSEFVIKNKRIDTLAFDQDSKAFVIIEYKRERNSSVVDQGFTYLSLMLQNKADFILEYNEKNPTAPLSRNEVDWSQSRVIFVSSDFTDNQIEATNFKDIAIELYEVKRYGDNLLVVPIKKSKAAESVKPITQKNKEYKSVADEIKVYTEDDFLTNKTDEIITLYGKYRTAILNLSDDIEVKPQKLYIAFKKNRRNICDVEIQNRGLKMTINVQKGNLDDAKNIVRDISGIGHWGNGDYELKISDDKNLEYVMSLVRQAIIE